jgi:hypothetical protein
MCGNNCNTAEPTDVLGICTNHQHYVYHNDYYDDNVNSVCLPAFAGGEHNDVNQYIYGSNHYHHD